MELLKVIIKRPRPANSLVHATGFSFPSAHVFEITLVIVTSQTILKNLRISERKKSNSSNNSISNLVFSCTI